MTADYDELREVETLCGCDTCGEDRGEPSPLFHEPPSPEGPAEHGGGCPAPGGDRLPGFPLPRTCLVCGAAATLAPDEVCSGCVGRVTTHGVR